MFLLLEFKFNGEVLCFWFIYGVDNKYAYYYYVLDTEGENIFCFKVAPEINIQKIILGYVREEQYKYVLYVCNVV